MVAITEKGRFELNWGESGPAYREYLDFELADSPLSPAADNAACGWLLFEDLTEQELAGVFRQLAEMFEGAAQKVEEYTESSKGGTE